ncbi:transcription factor WhiB [Williamsia sterculiae]|uniref:Transcriptional regulator WhiB n=1 Tax=Williamsia sterculiae TaxID=1344003 RepID=A0A1N7FQS5_9NOCA|nr:transcription factor WhiB [Williamsia sterculiae]
MAFEPMTGNGLQPVHDVHPSGVEPLGDGPSADAEIGDQAPVVDTPDVFEAAAVTATEPMVSAKPNHLSLVQNDFEDLFDAVEEEWQDRALCAQTDPEAFFPEKGGSTREAKRICQGCEVRSDCLEYALHKDERFGIWGGLSERERRRLKRGIV